MPRSVGIPPQGRNHRRGWLVAGGLVDRYGWDSSAVARNDRRGWLVVGEVVARYGWDSSARSEWQAWLVGGGWLGTAIVGIPRLPLRMTGPVGFGWGGWLGCDPGRGARLCAPTCIGIGCLSASAPLVSHSRSILARPLLSPPGGSCSPRFPAPRSPGPRTSEPSRFVGSRCPKYC